MQKLIVLLFGLLAPMAATIAQENQKFDTVKIDGLLNLSFEALMNVSVITPSKSAQHADQAPSTVLVVTRDQIQLRGYRTLAEIVNDLPDFIVNNKSDPQFYNAVGARGIFRQDYFVILMDGIRISSPTNEPLPMLENFPIYLAQQIEVVYGPGAALYGADAMAGVINIITKKGNEGDDITIHAMGGTQGYMNTSAIFNKTLQNDVTVTVAGQYSYDAQPDFSAVYKDQYRMTSHQTGVFNTSYGPVQVVTPVDPGYEAPINAYNVFASVVKDGFAMKILHHYVAVPTSTGLSPDNGVHNKDVFYGHGMTTGSMTYSTSLGKLKSTSALITSFYQVNPKSNFRNLYGGMEPGYKYSTGSMMKAEQQLDYSFSEKLNLLGGITYEFFQSIPKTPELQTPVGNKGSLSAILLNSMAENNPSGIEAKFFPLAYRNVGTFLQAQYFPGKLLSVTAGIRYDNNSRFGSTFNPRIGAVFNPFENTTFKAMYGTAYWAPSPLVSFETYGSFYTQDSGITYQSDYWHLPNPDLDPVTSQTLEVSLLQKFGKQLNLTITAYTTHIHNLIRDVPDNGNTDLYHNKFLGWDVAYIAVPINKGHQRNYGGNVTINSTFNIGRVKFNAYSSLSYLEGKEGKDATTDKEVEQAQIVPVQSRVGLDGKMGSFHFSVRLLTTSKQRTSRFEAENPDKRATISGYSLLNASAGYTFGRQTTFFINVYNALDQRYLNTLGWESMEFEGSYQDPLRAIAGFRLKL